MGLEALALRPSTTNVARACITAGIIDQPFYAVLVLLAVVTSLVAGTWLERIPRSKLLVRPDRAPNHTV